MKVILTRDADIDIDGILEYSLSMFGRSQAEKYFLGLKERIEKIANGFVSSADYSHIREGLKRTNYESHAIYGHESEELNSHLGYTKPLINPS